MHKGQSLRRQALASPNSLDHFDVSMLNISAGHWVPTYFVCRASTQGIGYRWSDYARRCLRFVGKKMSTQITSMRTT